MQFNLHVHLHNDTIERKLNILMHTVEELTDKVAENTAAITAMNEALTAEIEQINQLRESNATQIAALQAQVAQGQIDASAVDAAVTQLAANDAAIGESAARIAGIVPDVPVVPIVE